MEFPSLHRVFWTVLAVALPLASLTTCAEPHCPANVPGLSARIVAGALLVVPVEINHQGTFDFMVDTGSQLNVIDPALAARLELKPQGAVGLIKTATYSRALAGTLESLEAGSHNVAKPLVVVQDLGPIQAVDSRIRGVLGENFLAHFDVLLDYAHGLVCLDETNRMQGKLKGERVALVRSNQPEDDPLFSERLVVSVSLSDIRARQILLQLDSGSDGAILYAGNRTLEDPLLKRAKVRTSQASSAQRAFADLPPQDMVIGIRTMRRVAFVTPVNAADNLPEREEDGVLPTLLFHRVFISHFGHYAIFDPR